MPRNRGVDTRMPRADARPRPGVGHHGDCRTRRPPAHRAHQPPSAPQPSARTEGTHRDNNRLALPHHGARRYDSCRVLASGRGRTPLRHEILSTRRRRRPLARGGCNRPATPCEPHDHDHGPHDGHRSKGRAALPQQMQARRTRLGRHRAAVGRPRRCDSLPPGG